MAEGVKEQKRKNPLALVGMRRTECHHLSKCIEDGKQHHTGKRVEGWERQTVRTDWPAVLAQLTKRSISKQTKRVEYLGSQYGGDNTWKKEAKIQHTENWEGGGR